MFLFPRYYFNHPETLTNVTIFLLAILTLPQAFLWHPSVSYASSDPKKLIFFVSSTVYIGTKSTKDYSCFLSNHNRQKLHFLTHPIYSVELNIGSVILVICTLCWTALFDDLDNVIGDHHVENGHHREF
jgi:hypothetical protein